MASVAQQSGSKEESFEAAVVAAAEAAEKTVMAGQSDKPAAEKPGQTDNKKTGRRSAMAAGSTLRRGGG